MSNTVISLKKSSTPSAEPTILANGELAINYADGKLFYKHANGTILPFNTTGGNAFGTVNANGTLVVAGTSEAILTLISGNNISISADAINDTITIDSTGGASVNIGENPPSTAEDGDLWWSTVFGSLFIYYNDGNTAQWVETSPSSIYANTAEQLAIAAFDKANAANLLAYNTGIGANAFASATIAGANVISIAAFNKANAALPNTSDVSFAGNLYFPTGNVGIGTTSPTNPLQVTGTVKATSHLYVGSTSDDSYSGGIENLSNSSRSVGINADPTNSGASSIINFKIDGTEFMRLNSSGNLGIGTTSPSGKLHIADTSATYIFTSNSTSSYNTTFNMDNTGLDIGHNSVSRSINFLTGSLDRMTISGSGNVGIGVTTPVRKLDIYDSSNTLRNVLGVFNGVTGTLAQNNGVSILLGQSDAGYCAKISAIFESQNPDYLRPALAFFTMGDSYLIGSEVERMRISSGGYVGIGTTAPATILEINSNATTYWGQTTTNTWGGSLTPPQALTITNRYPSGYDPVMLFRQATSTGTIKTSGAIGMVGAANWLDGTPSSQISSMYFVVRNTTDGLNEVMRITADGRVGIGTTSPSYKLHVVGDTIVGVYGVSSTNIGVYGQSTSSYGVRGISSTSTGLYGSSTDGVGTYGFSTNNYGLYGQSDTTMGVYGRTNTTSGSGVYAYNSSSGKVCRLAYSTTYGVYTTGDIYTSGALSKGSGSFKIPHPLPELSETHNLVHSFVEAPTADNIYRGKVQLENGQATVNIDTHVGMTEGTFSALNGNIQVFLQNDSGWDLVRGSVSDNILTIISQDQSSIDTISWMVIGERQDQHMLDTQWTDEFGRPILEPVREPEPEPDIPLPEVSNENG